MREMNGKYVGNRPIKLRIVYTKIYGLYRPIGHRLVIPKYSRILYLDKLKRKSSWKDRQLEVVKKKTKEKRKLGYRV